MTLAQIWCYYQELYDPGDSPAVSDRESARIQRMAQAKREDRERWIERVLSSCPTP